MTQSSTKKQIIFKLHAPKANEVYLAGSFNDWNETGRPLKQDKQGTWRARLQLEPGIHEYRYVVDGKWQDDPGCQERCRNAFGTHNCLVYV